MVHPICRIASFDTVGAHTLRIGFDDGAERTMDFLPFWPEGFTRRNAIWRYLARSGSIPRFTLWCGPAARTSIPRPCTTGPNTWTH